MAQTSRVEKYTHCFNCQRFMRCNPNGGEAYHFIDGSGNSRVNEKGERTGPRAAKDCINYIDKRGTDDASRKAE